MRKMRAWLQAARPLAFGNIGLPIVYGAVLAAFAGQQRLEIAGLMWALVWGGLDQLFIVFANDVADEPLDRAQDHGTLVSGGSRVLVEGKLTTSALRRAAYLSAFVLCGGSVTAGWFYEAWFLPCCAAAALALVWAYSFAPLHRSYRNGGAALQATGMGIILPLGGWQLQGRAVAELFSGQIGGWPAPMWLLPGFQLAWCGNWLSALPDLESDRSGGKLTRPVRVGEARVAIESSLFILAAMLTLALMFPVDTLKMAIVSATLSLLLVGAHFARIRGKTLAFVIASLSVTSAVWLVAIGALLLAS